MGIFDRKKINIGRRDVTVTLQSQCLLSSSYRGDSR